MLSQRHSLVYLDYNASTFFPRSQLTVDLLELIEVAGANPSSLHLLGRKSRRLINEAAEALGSYLQVKPEAIYWTSGGAEANAFALHSAVLTHAHQKPLDKMRIVLSALEHDSTLLAAQKLAEQRSDLILEFIPVTADGVLDLDALKASIQDPTKASIALISCLFASNETGVLQPIVEVAKWCGSRGIPLHVDAVQALGKTPFSIQEFEGHLKTGYFTFSGHKIGAPKGVGCLIALGEGRILWPIVHGKQQKTLRGGTENSFAIGLFGKIIQTILKGDFQPFPDFLENLRNDFEAQLRPLNPIIHGQKVPRLKNTSYFGFEGLDGDSLLMTLDLEKVCASSGSACTSGSLDPSHVLMAMGCSRSLARSSIRLSSGYGTTWEDYQTVLKILPEFIKGISCLKK